MTQPAHGELEQASGHGWVVLAACVSAFAVAYNTTAVMTIVPAMKESLDLGNATLQWVINAYMLATAVSLTAMGHFADTFGMLRIFAIGIVVFALGSVTVGLADDAALILGGRALQGIGVAGLLATSVALINVSLPEAKRAGALGLWAGAVAVGFAAGPFIGGVLADAISWRAVFALDLLILASAGVLCFIIARTGLVPKALDKSRTTDFIGIGLLFVALGTFLYWLTAGPLFGWTSAITLVLLAVAIGGAVAFAVRDTRAEDPLIEFGFFSHADYVAGTAGMIINGFAQIGVLYFFNLFLQSQEGLNFSAAEAGLALLPFTGAMLAVALIAPRVLAPRDLGLALTGGMVALALGYWLMTGITSETPYGAIWWKLMIVGTGVGLCWALLPRIGMRTLPEENSGQASGVITTCNFVGLSLATAAGSVVAAHIKHSEVGPVIASLAPGTSNVEGLETALIHGTESEIAHALAKISPKDAERVEAAMRGVFDHAFSGVMTMMAVTGLMGAVFCFVLVGRRRAT